MKSICIVGHFAEINNSLDGQTIKTKNLFCQLKDSIEEGNVEKIDTQKWKSTPFKFLLRCIKSIKQYDNIIIMPASNGVKLFIPLFVVLNKKYKKNIIYVVIGGWLPNLLRKNKFLLYFSKKINSIHVETQSMKKALEEIGFDNIYYLPNFKRITTLNNSELMYQTHKPYKLCTFSRVMKEKGIEEAIEAVIDINTKMKEEVFNLDIYGQIDPKYLEEFDLKIKLLPKYISYKGVVDSDKSVEVLKKYYALIFPTYYEGEGFPGTILDALAAGVPVITSDWRYNSEIIEDGKQGYIFETKNLDMLKETLLKAYHNSTEVGHMKEECLKKSKEYSSNEVIQAFIKHIR